MKHTDSNKRSTLERPERATARERPTLRVLTEAEKESMRRVLKSAVDQLMK